MTTRHTEGPWEVKASTAFPGRYLIAQPRAETPVLAVATTVEVPLAAEEEANARLIAAAPDLLEALGGLLLAVPEIPGASWLDQWEELPAVLAAKAAILKASESP